METLPPTISSQEEFIAHVSQLGNAPLDREIGTGFHLSSRSSLIAEIRMGTFANILNGSSSKVNEDDNGNGKATDVEIISVPAIPERKPAPFNGGMTELESKKITASIRYQMGLGRRNR